MAHIPLYQLLDRTTGAPVPGLSFNTLTQARMMRRSCSREAKDPLRYVVAPGPAHPKYKPA